jgi:hypothetical protein
MNYTLQPLFLHRNYFNLMANELHHTPDRTDFGRNWVSSSRFLFHVQLFTFAAFVLGGCYGLYTLRYKGKPKVEVPESTQYTPKYK